MAFLEFNASRDSNVATFLCSEKMENSCVINFYRKEIFKYSENIDQYFDEKKSWKFIHSKKPQIDLKEYCDISMEKTTVLIYTNLNLKKEQSVLLHHEGRAKLKIWINGNLIADFNNYDRNRIKKDYQVPCYLKKGQNHFVLEVENEFNKSDFAISVLNHNKHPLKDYKILIPYESDNIEYAHRCYFRSLQVDIQKTNVENTDELNLLLHSDLNTCMFPDNMTGSIQISAMDDKICFERKLKHLPNNIFRFNFNRVELNLFSGLYKLNMVFHSALISEKIQVCYFIIYPEMKKKIKKYYEKIRSIKSKLTNNQKYKHLCNLALPRVEYKIIFLEELWNSQINNKHDYELLSSLIEEISNELESLEQFKDPLKGRTGYIKSAYYHEHCDSPVPYSIYIPKDYDPNKKYPLIVGLHGYKSNHYKFLNRFFNLNQHNLDKIFVSSKTEFEFPDTECIVLAINGFGSINYDSYAETDFFSTYHNVKHYYSIDESKIYLVGISMGGTGALYLLTHYPDIFTAGAMLCPIYDYSLFIPDNLFSRLSIQQKHLMDIYGYHNYLNNLKNIPIYIIHGSNDSVISVEHSRKLIEDLNSLGYSSTYLEFANFDHDVWQIAFQNELIQNLLLKHSKADWDTKAVAFSSSDLTYNQKGFLTILQAKKNRELMNFDSFIHKNQLHIKTQNISVFQLKKDFFIANQINSLCINGYTVNLNTQLEKDIFIKIEDNKIFLIPDAEKDNSLYPSQGIFQVFKEWHTYVISNNIDKQMKQFIEKLTLFKTMDHISFPIKTAETADLTDDRLGNIVLVGTPDSNIHIERLFKKLKIQYDPKKLVLFGQEFHGSPIQAVFYYTNPYNPKRKIACYLVSHPDYFPENFIHHNIWYGPYYFTDYFVFNRDKPAHFGIFEETWPTL